MSGLFRRLAQGAVGAPPARLHALARLPYASPPLPALDEPAERQGALPMVAAQAHVEPNAIAAPGAPPSIASPAIVAPRAAESAYPSVVAPHAPHAPHAPCEPAGRQDGRGASELDARLSHESPSLLAQPALRAPQPVRAAPPAHERARSLIGSEAQAFRPPPPLLAATAVEPTRAAVGRPAAPAPLRLPAQQASVDAPNEVHVHIGRVEVTAIREAARQPRAARRGPEPLSLDHYLAKRGERRG